MVEHLDAQNQISAVWILFFGIRAVSLLLGLDFRCYPKSGLQNHTGSGRRICNIAVSHRYWEGATPDIYIFHIRSAVSKCQEFVILILSHEHTTIMPCTLPRPLKMRSFCAKGVKARRGTQAHFPPSLLRSHQIFIKVIGVFL